MVRIVISTTTNTATHITRWMSFKGCTKKRDNIIRSSNLTLNKKLVDNLELTAILDKTIFVKIIQSAVKKKKKKKNNAFKQNLV